MGMSFPERACARELREERRAACRGVRSVR